MPIVILKTNIEVNGSRDIKIELDEKAAPITVQNFLNYVESGHYNGTIFHRVIPGFMIQGGGLDANMTAKDDLARPIANEANNGLKNQIFTVAMARTSDPDSATSQFFINVVDNNFLDYTAPTLQGWGYCVFGKVIEGQEIVMAISHVNTINHPTGHQNVPERPIVIESATVELELEQKATSSMAKL